MNLHKYLDSITPTNIFNNKINPIPRNLINKPFGSWKTMELKHFNNAIRLKEKKSQNIHHRSHSIRENVDNDSNN